MLQGNNTNLSQTFAENTKAVATSKNNYVHEMPASLMNVDRILVNEFSNM